ncbi:MAG: hypothetical protein HOP22_12120 [Nitrospiraceae bacterium]|nr:hypothetical protein [Nitrospiraceae bacterium]
MVSAPKIIGLMSCGFLLCLGLSNTAQAENAAPAVEGEKASTPHARQPGDPRVGGQGGQPAAALKGEADKPHARQKGDPRVGGQGGQPDKGQALKGEAGTPHARQKGGPRVGGQGGQ